MTTNRRAVPAAPSTVDAGHDAGRSRRAWLTIGLAIVLAGTTCSFLGARSVAAADEEEARNAFRSASADVAATLDAAIEAEADLVINAAAYLVDNPDTSNEEFVAWAENVRLTDRYPQLRSILLATTVAHEDLDEFLDEVTARLTPGVAEDGTATVVPEGRRDTYCLTFAKQARGTALPPGMDFCQTALGPVLLSARDSGTSSYVAITDETFTSAVLGSETSPPDISEVEDVAFLLIQSPVYRSGAAPETLEQRRQEFLGWVGAAVSPDVLLDAALLGHDDVAMTFRYETGGSSVVFSRGEVGAGGETQSFDFGNGWTVDTFGVVDGSGLLSTREAVVVLVGGIGLSLALAALVVTLSTGRARALRSVRRMADQLRHQALHDPLTGLPNRALIVDRAEQLLARSRRDDTVVAALFVDLDEFKNINDTLGHDAGDEILRAVAARFTNTLRSADTIGRLGGDEFVVLVGDKSPDAATLVAERLLDAMREPFTLGAAAKPITVSASIGIAVGDRGSPGDLLRDADVALYRAKEAGRNCHATFSAEMQAFVEDRLELEFDLRSALDGDQFRIVYQPIYDLDDLSLVDVEALLRWDHPGRGVIPPDGFIGLLESAGRIAAVGRWVLAEACRRTASWRSRGIRIGVSVNMSGRQLSENTVVDDVGDALDASGLSPGALTVEITESVLMRDVESTAERLRDLKALGVKIAIDDFGTGYSSLAYLQRFPVDLVKIDRSFTAAMSTSKESAALMHTLVQVGHSLGLQTVAEGVETTEQIDRLRAEGVDRVQGYLLSRPLDVAALESRIFQPVRTEDPSGPPRVRPGEAE